MEDEKGHYTYQGEREREIDKRNDRHCEANLKLSILDKNEIGEMG